MAHMDTLTWHVLKFGYIISKSDEILGIISEVFSNVISLLFIQWKPYIYLIWYLLNLT
jgi:hypothetical protein